MRAAALFALKGRVDAYFGAQGQVAHNDGLHPFQVILAAGSGKRHAVELLSQGPDVFIRLGKPPAVAVIIETRVADFIKRCEGIGRAEAGLVVERGLKPGKLALQVVRVGKGRRTRKNGRAFPGGSAVGQHFRQPVAAAERAEKTAGYFPGSKQPRNARDGKIRFHHNAAHAVFVAKADLKPLAVGDNVIRKPGQINTVVMSLAVPCAL